MASADTLRDDVSAQLRTLRDQVNHLMDDKVTPAWNDAADRASVASRRARAYASDQADAVSGQVRDTPLIAIAVAGAVGFLAGRLTR